MSYAELLERMMHRETDAFLEFTDRYGWVLYNSIRKKHPNKTDADKVYHETLQQLWSCLQNSQFEDPMEAILCVWADHITLKRDPRKNLADIFMPDPEEEPPVLHIRRSEERCERISANRPHRFWRILGVLVLVFLFLLSLWIIIGFLMENEMISYVDLGYSWFCRWLQQILFSWGIL